MTVEFVYVCTDMTGDNSTGLDSNNIATTHASASFLDSGWMIAAAVNMDYALICIGIIGTAANALVLYALIVHNARETKKRMVNWLIINQNFIDLCCSFAIVVSLSIRVSNIYLTGAIGYILCTIFINENAAMCLLNSTVINLVTITVERYLKIVYPFWSKRNLKSWMIRAAIVFSWIAGILSVAPLAVATSFVREGTCQPLQLFWENAEIRDGYGVWNFVSFFLIPLIIFVYCYGHMVVVMRKQMRVMAGHNVEGSAQSASQAQNKRIKWNIIKTMIIVSAFFIVCWFPLNVYMMVVGTMDTSELVIGSLITLFLPYINISLNPFIYSTKHEGVRRILARMIVCRKHDDVAAVTGTAAGTGSNTGRAETKTTKNTGRCDK